MSLAIAQTVMANSYSSMERSIASKSELLTNSNKAIPFIDGNSKDNQMVHFSQSTKFNDTLEKNETEASLDLNQTLESER